MNTVPIKTLPAASKDIDPATIHRLYHEEGMTMRAVAELCGMIENSAELVETLKEQIALITDTAPIVTKIDKLTAESAAIQAQMDELVNARARAAISHAAFEKQYAPLAKRNDKVAAELEGLGFELIAGRNRRVRLEQFIDALGGEIMIDFDDEVWRAMVESVTVEVGGGLTFRFVDGSEIAG